MIKMTVLYVNEVGVNRDSGELCQGGLRIQPKVLQVLLILVERCPGTATKREFFDRGMVEYVCQRECLASSDNRTKASFRRIRYPNYSTCWL